MPTVTIAASHTRVVVMQTLRNLAPNLIVPLKEALEATLPYCAPPAEVVASSDLAGHDAKFKAAAWKPSLAVAHALRSLVASGRVALPDGVIFITAAAVVSLDGFDPEANYRHMIGGSISIRKVFGGVREAGKQTGQVLFQQASAASPFACLDILLCDGSDKSPDLMARIANWVEGDLAELREHGLNLPIDEDGFLPPLPAVPPFSDPPAGYRLLHVAFKVFWSADSLVVRAFLRLQPDGSLFVSPQRNTVRGRASDPRKEGAWLWRVRPLMSVQGAVADALSGWGKAGDVKAPGLPPAAALTRIRSVLDQHRAAIEAEGEAYKCLVDELEEILSELETRWGEMTAAAQDAHPRFNTILTALESQWLDCFRWGSAGEPLINVDPRHDMPVDLLHRGINKTAKHINFARTIYEQEFPLADFPDEMRPAQADGTPAKRLHKKLYAELRALNIPMIRPQLEGNQTKIFQANVPQWMLGLTRDESKTVDDMRRSVDDCLRAWEERCSPAAVAARKQARAAKLAEAMAMYP